MWTRNALPLAIVFACAATLAAQSPRFGVGRPPTPDEVRGLGAAIAPDGDGLPAGAGTVAEGRTVFAARCASCHGPNGEGGGVGAVLVGGQGTLATARPLKTVGSFWPQATTVWDYVNRAMPFDQPGLLKPDEVYAVVAYVLNLNGIVGADAVMNARTLPAVKMPNRDGFVADPRPDVGAEMKMGDVNHPTGTRGLLLIDKLGGTIRFFDPATFTERASIKAATNPHDFALTADRKTAYVPLYGDGVYGRNPNPGHEVLIVDTESAKVVGTIDVAPYRAPHGIQLDPSGTIYVSSDLDRKLLVIDPKARKITHAIDTEGTTHWIGMLPDGSKIYATNKNDGPFVSVIDVKSRKMTGRIAVPGGTQGIAVSPDGSRVVIMAMAEPAALVIDPKSDTVVDRIPLMDQKTGAYKAYFSPDGKRLLTMNSGSSVINIFDAANLHGTQRTVTVGKDPMGFAFSADGKTALSANHGDGTVSVIDLEKGETVRTFKAGTGIETLAYY